MMTKEAYIALYEKCAAGRCSLDELRMLEAYHDSFNLEDMPWDESKMGSREEIKQRIYNRLEREMKRFPERKRRNTIYRWPRYAAAAILLLAALVYLSVQRDILPGKQVAKNNMPIVPGGNKALLTLEDGTQVALDQLEVGELVLQNHVVVDKMADGQLNYHKSRTVNSETASYHTITTPRGGQYQINLPDGTKVWLNAASSIRFPTTFNQAERTVKIEGEVYFDVEKLHGKPFVVLAKDQRITVLGTRFNVMAYPDEETIETSLLEGKVAVSISDKVYALAPGQRTTFHKEGGKVRISSVGVEEAVAWKAGYFKFNAEPIESIMRKISRWYDVEVAYEGSMERKLFKGTVSRYGQVEEVLDLLALTGTVSFKIEGRRIVVME